MDRIRRIYFCWYSLVVISSSAQIADKNISVHPINYYTIKPNFVPLSLNGILLEWNYADSLVMYSNMNKGNNKVVIKTLWDYEKLYIAYHVVDADINSKCLTNDDPKISRDDEVEFYITTDPKNAPQYYMSPNEYQFMINLNGSLYTVNGFNTKSTITQDRNKNLIWDADVLTGVKHYGTLNNHSDVDIGYDIEAAIYWSDLGYVPHSGDTLQVDFCIGDNDHDTLYTFDWSKLDFYTQPSRWKKIILSGTPKETSRKNARAESENITGVDENIIFPFIVIIVLLIGAGAVFYFYVVKKDKRADDEYVDFEEVGHQKQLKKHDPYLLHKHEGNDNKPSAYSMDIAGKCMDIIENEYNNDLHTENVAAQLYLSERHLQRILKQVYNKTFREILNDIRIEKSEVLLRSTNMSIADIGYEVGFQTFNHFRRVFKEFHHISPSDYRKKHSDT